VIVKEKSRKWERDKNKGEVVIRNLCWCASARGKESASVAELRRRRKKKRKSKK